MNPHSTGQVAKMLGTTEPKVSEAVRQGKVAPPPQVVAGRRMWELFHIRQAAEALGATKFLTELGTLGEGGQ